MMQRETKGGPQIFFARNIYRGGQRHFRSEIQTKRARVRNFFDKTLDRSAHDTLYKTVRAIIESRM